MSINNSSLYLKGFTSQLTEFVTDLLLIYEDNQKFVFMDQDTYEQIELGTDIIEEGLAVAVLVS